MTDQISFSKVSIRCVLDTVMIICWFPAQTEFYFLIYVAAAAETSQNRGGWQKKVPAMTDVTHLSVWLKIGLLINNCRTCINIEIPFIP